MNMRAALVAALPERVRRHAARVDASPIASRLASGAFWSLTGASVSRALALLSGIVVARILGKEGYGELGIVLATAGLFLSAGAAGLGVTATKYIAEFRTKDVRRAGRILALSRAVATVTGAGCALTLAVAAPWLATHTLAAPHLAGLLRIAAIIVFLGIVSVVQTGALSGFEAFQAVAWSGAASGGAASCLLIAGVVWLGIEGGVWAVAIGAAVTWGLNHLVLRREARKASVPLGLAGCHHERSIFLTYSLPAAIGTLLIVPVNWACSALLVNQPNGHGEFGVYTAANQWFAAVTFLPTALYQSVLPVMSEQIGKGQWRTSARILRATIGATAVPVIPLVVLGCLASPLVMRWYGKGFEQAWPTLIVVLLTAGLIAIEMPAGCFIAASGRMWTGFVISGGWAIVFAAATWLWVDRGALGLAAARLGAYAVHAIGTFGFAYVLIRSGRRSAPLAEPTIPGDAPRQVTVAIVNGAPDGDDAPAFPPLPVTEGSRR
jgi:O-antigen/teichoic acid export membrane protein